MEIGPYRVERELGRGGMGAVYLCRDASGAPLAVKVVHAGLLVEEDVLSRFEREGRALETLNHPHVIGLRGRGQGARGGLWLAMDFVEGESLQERLSRRGPFSSDEARALMISICAGVEHAHERGVLHRDLKPDNVLLRASDGQPLVVDFGLALPSDASEHLTRTGEVLGSPGYLAPEQCGLSGGSSPATDVYGLGALLYALLTAQPPLRGRSLIHTLDMVLNERPAAPSTVVHEVDPSLEALCLRCLEKDPADRFQSAGQLAEALRRREVSPTSRLPLRAIAACVATIAAFLVGVVLALYAEGPASQGPSPARSLAESSPAAPSPEASPGLGPAVSVPGETGPLERAAEALEAGRLAEAWDALDDYDLALPLRASDRALVRTRFLRARLFEATGSSAAESIYRVLAESEHVTAAERWRARWRGALLTARRAPESALQSLAASPPPAEVADALQRSYDLHLARLLIGQGAALGELVKVFERRGVPWRPEDLPPELQGPYAVVQAEIEALKGVSSARVLRGLKRAEAAGLDEAWRHALHLVLVRRAAPKELRAWWEAACNSRDSLRVASLLEAGLDAFGRDVGDRQQALYHLKHECEAWLRRYAQDHLEALLERGRTGEALRFARSTRTSPSGELTPHFAARMVLRALGRSLTPEPSSAWAKVVEREWAEARKQLDAKLVPDQALLACFEVLALTTRAEAPSADMGLQLFVLAEAIQRGLDARRSRKPAWGVLHEGLFRCHYAQIMVAREDTVRLDSTARARAGLAAWRSAPDNRGLDRFAGEVLRPPGLLRDELLSLASGRARRVGAFWAQREVLYRQRVPRQRELIRAWGPWLRSGRVLDHERRSALFGLGNRRVNVVSLEGTEGAAAAMRWVGDWTPEDGGSALSSARLQGVLLLAEGKPAEGEALFARGLKAPQTPWTARHRALLHVVRASNLAHMGKVEEGQAQVALGYAAEPSARLFQSWGKVLESLGTEEGNRAAVEAYVRFLGHGLPARVRQVVLKKILALGGDRAKVWRRVSWLLDARKLSALRAPIAEELFAADALALKSAYGQVVVSLQRARASPTKEGRAALDSLVPQLTAHERRLWGWQSALILAGRSFAQGRTQATDLRAALTTFRQQTATLRQSTRDEWGFPQDEANALTLLSRAEAGAREEYADLLEAWISRGGAPPSAGADVVRLLSRGGFFARAQRSLEAAVGLRDPSLPFVRFGQWAAAASLRIAHGDSLGALRFLDLLLAQGPIGLNERTFEISARRGELLAKLKRPEAARAAFAQTLSLGGALGPGYRFRARVAQARGLAELGELEAAMTSIAEARELAKAAQESHRGIVDAVTARVLRLRKDPVGAEAAARRALKRLGKREEETRVLVLEELAILLQARGEREEARAKLEEILELRWIPPAHRERLEAQLRGLAEVRPR